MNRIRSCNPAIRGALARRTLAAALCLALAAPAWADSVTDWSAIGNNAAVASFGPSPIQSSRVMAMEMVAVHDALNNIDARYEAYADHQPAASDSCPDAAVAAAAYNVLSVQLPGQAAALQTQYNAAIAALSGSGCSIAHGVAAGEHSAAIMNALRANDGSVAAFLPPYAPYFGSTAIGKWRPVPPIDFVPGDGPGWHFVTPWVINSRDQFVADPAPYLTLTSTDWARDYNEVKALGAATGSTRTADQSEIAMFWYAASSPAWGGIAANAAGQAHLGLWENARLFALLDLALADNVIAMCNSKYLYAFWRPLTAIRSGGLDGNPATTADPSWDAFLVTPPIPEFPSGHASAGGAAAEVLRRYFGTDAVAFGFTAGPPFGGVVQPRHFTSFTQAERENADSRVLAGIHFRSSVNAGMRLGEQVGRYVIQHSLKPLKSNQTVKANLVAAPMPLQASRPAGRMMQRALRVQPKSTR